MLNQIIQGDCYELMKGIPDGSIDLVLTDPPYNTTEGECDKQPFNSILFWQEVKRFLKVKGTVVMTSSQPFTTDLIMSNREWFKYCAVWAKTRSSGFINAKNQLLKTHEDICIFSPGTIANKSLNLMTFNPQGLIYRPYHKVRNKPMSAKDGGFIRKRPNHVSEYQVEYINYPTSILEFANPNNKNEHPFQKPVALFDYLIRTYTNPGETVLDPFAGSGTTALAAHATGRQFLLFEKEPKYVEIANKRLALAQMQGRFEEMVG